MKLQKVTFYLEPGQVEELKAQAKREPAHDKGRHSYANVARRYINEGVARDRSN